MMSNAKRGDNKPQNVFERIKENYSHLNQMMVKEIDLASSHDGTTGNSREEMWMKFFRSIIPLKYTLAQGVIIIDSKNGNSREVDIAVYDEQYTPYVFQYNTLKFIPIEAVAVVIECKSTQWEVEGLKEWAETITKLESCPSGIARMATGYSIGITNRTQKRTRPIFILASNFQRVTETAIENNVEPIGDTFDFILIKKSEPNTEGKQREFQLEVKNEGKKLGWWGNKLNGTTDREEDLCIGSSDQHKKLLEEARICGKCEELDFCEDPTHLQNTLKDLQVPDNALLTLNFQLNQLLMLINNPILFPHLAYAKAFREIDQNIKGGS